MNAFKQLSGDLEHFSLRNTLLALFLFLLLNPINQVTFLAQLKNDAHIPLASKACLNCEGVYKLDNIDVVNFL